MGALVPDPRRGKVNGLQPASRRFHMRLRKPVFPPTPLLFAGVGLYAIALVFPLFLHQITIPIAAVAVLGTVLLLAGLHVRWNREPSTA